MSDVDVKVKCRYCLRPATKPEEIERKSIIMGCGTPYRYETVCNMCGGYSTCLKCGKIWENLEQEEDATCFDCVEKEEINDRQEIQGA